MNCLAGLAGYSNTVFPPEGIEQMASAHEVIYLAVITDVDGVGNGGVIDNEKPLISGRADPFATIDVHDGTALLGVAAANGQGGWTLQLSSPLFDGVHDLSATQDTGYGVRSVASYFAVTVKALEGAPMSADDAFAPATATSASGGSGEPGVPFFPPNVFNSRRGAAVSNAAYTHSANPGDAQALAISALSADASSADPHA